MQHHLCLPLLLPSLGLQQADVPCVHLCTYNFTTSTIIRYTQALLLFSLHRCVLQPFRLYSRNIQLSQGTRCSTTYVWSTWGSHQMLEKKKQDKLKNEMLDQKNTGISPGELERFTCTHPPMKNKQIFLMRKKLHHVKTILIMLASVHKSTMKSIKP